MELTIKIANDQNIWGIFNTNIKGVQGLERWCSQYDRELHGMNEEWILIRSCHVNTAQHGHCILPRVVNSDKMSMIQFSKKPFLKTIKQRATEQDIQGTISDFTWTRVGGHTHTFVRMLCIYKHTYNFQHRNKEKKTEILKGFILYLRKITSQTQDVLLGLHWMILILNEQSISTKTILKCWGRDKIKYPSRNKDMRMYLFLLTDSSKQCCLSNALKKYTSTKKEHVIMSFSVSAASSCIIWFIATLFVVSLWILTPITELFMNWAISTFFSEFFSE